MSPEGSSPTRRTGLGSLATKSSAAAAGGGKADALVTTNRPRLSRHPSLSIVYDLTVAVCVLWLQDTGGLPSATGDGFSGAKTVRQEAKKVAAVRLSAWPL